MNYWYKIICLFVGVTALGGCAHSIQLSPNLDNIREIKVSEKIDKNVGYYISRNDLNKEVITPGGGGDKVKYQPYKDTEAALNTILSRVFNKVYFVNDIGDIHYLSDKNIIYIFKPNIKTDSSSNSPFTWPPTEFIFELTCSAIDATGTNIWEKTVTAKGQAEFSEFKNDFSLSARRASDKAFQKMMIEISNANKF